MPGPVARAVRHVGGRVLDVLLPPRCPACAAMVASGGLLCADCWSRVRFLGGPACPTCGHPFEYDPGPGLVCAACAARPPVYARSRAAVVYDGESRALVLAFKHGDRTDLVPGLARWLLRAGADLIEGADVIAPVPLHWTRLFVRRYNQAGLLANRIGADTGVPVVPDLLVRRRRTPSQGGLSPGARRRNVAGAFDVHPGRAAHVSGKRVLLVDDVLTTGATAEAAAARLLAAGAAAVDTLTLARVLRSTRL